MRAVVLDRDGVINDNREHIHVHSPQELVLFPWTAEAIRRLNEAGWLVMVATNQGGVGLGFLTREDLAAVHEALRARLRAEGAVIDEIAACIHAPDAGCACRKPRPGLLYELWRRRPFDVTQSYMVGDRETDILAGRAMGMRTIFVGRGPTTADDRAANLLAAVRIILRRGGAGR